MKSCHCGLTVSKNYDNVYCSYYCKLFKEGNHKMKGSKYPVIKLECEHCGDKFDFRKANNYEVCFCSVECKSKIYKINVPKPRMNYLVLKYLKTHEGWNIMNNLNRFMEKHSFRSHENRWQGILKRWIIAGIVHKTMDKPYQYKFNPQYKDVPIVKLLITVRGLKE